MQALNRRAVALGLAFLYTLAFVGGCQNLGRPRRNQGDPDVTRAAAAGEEVESNKILDVQSDSSNARPFFRPTRLPGGLSDEAREIESHMNIR
jgi:hypothetical protein